MNLIQWNIQWCRGLDGKVDPRRIVESARTFADFDVLCLQEVAINFPALAGSVGEDQAAALSAVLPEYEALYAAAVDVPGEHGVRRRFGNMIFSRFPVRQVFRHALPWPADDDIPSMPRVALEAVIDSPLGALRVITTHLEYYSATQRDAQIGRLRGLHAEACGHARARPSAEYRDGPFQRFPRPVPAILCGDFNLPGGPADPAYARLQEPIGSDTPRFVDAWQHAHPGVAHPPTFCVHEHGHADTPYCCDFVFVTEDLVPRLKNVTIDSETQASDHQPVIVEFG
ncbi:MAG: endonuclease/exonuclease/phosphatase family protein [Betaproteobacteria bacterium]|nr:endonuclease/exonuclease/phosphatase family protein [Betaproteobacteria bacterium]